MKTNFNPSRRSFLKKSGLASTSLLVPSFLKGFEFSPENLNTNGRILVVVQLSGGNDWLNTFVPYRNDLYYKARPNIGISKEDALSLTDEIGLNPTMESLNRLYDDGLLAVYNSVGYPEPNRSHFRSMEIWHTASNSEEYLNTGWLGRYLDSNCETCDLPHHLLELDDTSSLAVKGENNSGFAIANAKKLKHVRNNKLLKSLADAHQHEHENPVEYLYKTLINTQSSADYLFEQSKIYSSSISYPQNAFGNDLKQVSELIVANTNTKVYYLTLSGFDTHANQKGQQERLLKIYADGMLAFLQDLKQNNRDKDVLCLTFSEFGRRVQQNASRGTDHGTAGNVLLLGSPLKKQGILNQGPNLADLDNGDLRFKTDFRQIYATILDKWLGADSTKILNQKFNHLAFL